MHVLRNLETVPSTALELLGSSEQIARKIVRHDRRLHGGHSSSCEGLRYLLWVDEDGILRSVATARRHSQPGWLGWTLKDGSGLWQCEDGYRTGRA